MRLVDNFTPVSSSFGSTLENLKFNFLKQVVGDSIAIQENLKLNSSILELVDRVTSCIKKTTYPGTIQLSSMQDYLITLERDGKYELMVMVYTPATNDPFERVKGSFGIDAIGKRDIVTRLKSIMDEDIRNENLSQVNWYYLVKNEPQARRIILDEPKVVHQEFYPWMKEDLGTYFRRFLRSDCSILLLFGPPGTGKTSFLRHFLHSNQLNAIITYDELLLQSDSMFVDFLTGEDDILIIEDADLMLAAREDSRNQMMARFLNVSDGMIKFGKKKAIFTTNLNSTKTVDPALLRPGRCFDVINFRPMSYSETLNAATVAGIEKPSVEKNYTLAELFNPATADTFEVRMNKVGFRV